MKFPSKARAGAVGVALMAGVTLVAAALVWHQRPANPAVGHSFVTYPPGGGSSHSIGGGTLTVGLQVLTLRRGARPVVLTGVELVQPRGLTLVGRRLAGPSRAVYQFLSVPGFPPIEYDPKSVAAVGATIDAAKRGWLLLLGVRASPSTYAKTIGIRVEYKIAGTSAVEEQTFPVTFVVCTERSQLVNGACPPPNI